MHEKRDLKSYEFHTHQLPQTYSFACPQAKKRLLTCPQAIQLDFKAIFLSTITFKIPTLEFNGLIIMI